MASSNSLTFSNHKTGTHKMTNEDFQNVIETSFTAFLSCGTSRSTQKLIPLHGAIAHDMHERLGDGYEIQSQGYANGKEGNS